MAILLSAACARPPQVGEPIRGLDAAQRADFGRGRAVFQHTFTPETGLGPLFNAAACAECHEDPVVGGIGDETELHGSITKPDSCDLLADRGGPVFESHVTPALHDALGIDREPVPADADTTHRTAPDLFGFGLLEAVPDAEILSHADPNDADGDGISGRPNRFTDGRIGRFGRKAFIPTLAEFNAAAFQIEMGITVPGAADEGTIGGQPIPPGVDPLPEPELPAESLRVATAFVRFLAPPPRPHLQGDDHRGEELFERLRCTACHVPELHTGPSDVPALAYREVHAYTDLLLHDMGPELADICFGEASPAEFRTEPLMGLRFASRFLHDGRATSIEEAIRMHAGEATHSRNAFVALDVHNRAALLAFLQKL